MTTPLPGLHHVTAISGPPQPNVDFYTKTLGQRLVKQTVNFDAPDVYHLYYGTQDAAPGSILTFFPFLDAGPGRAGPGMASAFAYAVPKAAFDRWMERLALQVVDFEGPAERFGQRVLTLKDPDGLTVELIEDDRAEGEAMGEAFDGFHSATLWVRQPEKTARILTDVFGYQATGHVTGPEGERLRFSAGGDKRARAIDLIRSDAPSIGRQGAGTIHHIAFRAFDNAMQDEVREALKSAGMQVTERIDRQYFNAIYFREPNGVLFEVATDNPGFDVDEPMAELGRTLKLPPQYEPHRARIERALPPLKVPA